MTNILIRLKFAEALPFTVWLASWYNPKAVCVGFEVKQPYNKSFSL